MLEKRLEEQNALLARHNQLLSLMFKNGPVRPNPSAASPVPDAPSSVPSHGNAGAWEPVQRPTQATPEALPAKQPPAAAVPTKTPATASPKSIKEEEDKTLVIEPELAEMDSILDEETGKLKTTLPPTKRVPSKPKKKSLIDGRKPKSQR